jgi:hypothetical protein
METIAADMVERVFDAEIHHVRAIRIHRWRVFSRDRWGIVDGTWPHVVDPKIPGAVDEIIWHGDLLDEAAVEPIRKATFRLKRV